MTQDFRQFKIYICSWDIVAYDVDQYGQRRMDCNYEVLESHNDRVSAEERLPIFAVQNKWNKNWTKIGASDYRMVDVVYQEKLHSSELRAYNAS